MFVVRNVFRTRPGKAKALVAKFKAAAPHFAELGIRNTRILTDAVADFWTVVIESEVEDLSDYLHQVETRGANADVRDALAGYMDLVLEGRREVLRVE
jgi:hypothetical protein